MFLTLCPLILLSFVATFGKFKHPREYELGPDVYVRRGQCSTWLFFLKPVLTLLPWSTNRSTSEATFVRESQWIGFISTPDPFWSMSLKVIVNLSEPYLSQLLIFILCFHFDFILPLLKVFFGPKAHNRLSATSFSLFQVLWILVYPPSTNSGFWTQLNPEVLLFFRMVCKQGGNKCQADLASTRYNWNDETKKNRL